MRDTPPSGVGILLSAGSLSGQRDGRGCSWSSLITVQLQFYTLAAVGQETAESLSRPQCLSRTYRRTTPCVFALGPVCVCVSLCDYGVSGNLGKRPLADSS